MSFDAKLAAADQAAARFFDRTVFTAIAMTKPARAVNAAEIADPVRPAFGFAGTLDAAPEFTPFAGASRPGASDRQVRQISRFCLSAFTAGWLWIPRQDDRIRGPRGLYKVAANPDDDHTGRVVFWLNRISL